MAFDININIVKLMDIFNENGIYVEKTFVKGINKQMVIFNYKNFHNANISFENIIFEAIPNMENIGIKNFEINDNLEMLLNIMFLYILNQKINIW